MLSTGFIVSHHPKEGLNTDLFWWPAILGCSSTDGIHHCAAKNKLRAQVEGRKTHILWDGRTCPASQLPQKFFDRWEDVASVPLHLRVKALCLVNEPASCAAELSAIKSHPVSLHWAWYLHDKDEKCLSQWFQLISRQSRQCSPVGKINYSLSQTRAGEKWRIETAKFQLVGDSLHIWVVISRGLSWPAVVSKSRTPFHPMV